ncbi:lysylphosphatidylglycerol synthase transmembrane domain-containing protein [Enterococcus lactis]|uniref:lysylphosphatidylglycerol synthase transmembrane domain-containing protein n=1 Tax=Enterococcus lactis TaxID=357441 RepID=UPI0022E163F9|nr:lysylphosphatidylglycerol synthase transmembrane domain-containing protein [Enterococcus lactis]
MSSKGTKIKIILNLLLLIAIFAIIYYLINQSFADIFAELMSTSVVVLAATVILGTVYQIAEGRSIKEIAEPFAPNFTTKDGFTGTLISEIYFYNKKGMKLSQGAGVTALHMIMYKLAVITYALAGLLIQFSLFYSNSPSMIWFIIAGILLTIVIVAFLLVMSISLNVQIFFVSLSNKLFKSERLRKWVDTCNQQIYSLRETVQTIIQDRTALLRIYLWNMLKLVFWYVLPYLILIENHPKIDFLLTISFISFAVVLSGVIPTPAGIGSFEFVYLLLFRPVVGTVDAVSSLLLYRFSSFILPFLYGFVYVIAERRRVIKEEIIEVKKENKENQG